MVYNNESYIPLSVPNLSELEIESVTRTLRQGWISSVGPVVTEFEDAVAHFVGAKHACACSSGTTAIHLALLALGVDKSDIILVPTLTFIAAVNPVKYIGAEPVFFDCDESLCIDPTQVREFLESECSIKDGFTIHEASKKIVKALIIVHVFGNIADMPEFIDISNKYNIRIIEDATEALGSKYIDGTLDNGFAGTFCDVGVYSFNGNKIISTGSGGMLVSNNQSIINKARHLSTQAKVDSLYYLHDEVGFNYRLTSVQAALGLAQLKRLEDFVAHKSTSNKFYSEFFKTNDSLELLEYRKGTRPNYWLSSLQLLDSNKRDKLILYMKSNEIEVRPIWDLIHKQKPYLDYRIYGSRNAESYLNSVINIPSSTNLTLDNLKRVSETIGRFINENK